METKFTPRPWKIKPVFTCQSDGDAICFSEYRMIIDGHEYLVTYRERAEANARLMEASPDMHEALTVIAEALREPAGGSYWPARKFLDDRDIFNDDLDSERVLLRVAEAALAGKNFAPECTQKQKGCAGDRTTP